MYNWPLADTGAELILFFVPIQVAHPLVQKQLVDYIHNGFLVPVMGPALHKVRVMVARQIKGLG